MSEKTIRQSMAFLQYHTNNTMTHQLRRHRPTTFFASFLPRWSRYQPEQRCSAQTLPNYPYYRQYHHQPDLYQTHRRARTGSTIRAFHDSFSQNLTHDGFPTKRNLYSQPFPTKRLFFSTVSSTDAPPSSWMPLTQALQTQIDAGHWRPDPVQRRTAKKLERLQQVLKGYSNEPLIQALERHDRERQTREQNEATTSDQNQSNGDVPSSTISDTTADSSPTSSLDTSTLTTHDDDHKSTSALPPPMKIPRGLYLHGSVGVGKSGLMDLFFQHAPLPPHRTKRFHFHQFMANVHQRIHQLQQLQLQTHGRSFHVDQSFHPIRLVAQQLARETTLLCLDEFQVTDIADAVILKQLFETLWQWGTVVVATSNGAPQQLYEGGLNRFAFLSFIDLLERHMVVHNLSSDTDYRLVLSRDDDTNNNRQGFYAHAEDLPRAQEAFPSLIEQFRGQDNDIITNQTLPVTASRSLTIARGDTNGRVAECTWQELCRHEYGASDYRVLAQHYAVVAITGIPIMSLEEHPNESKRFVTLLDELYESKSTALLCVADHEDPFELFQGRRKRSNDQDDANTWEAPEGNATTLGIDQAEQQGQSVGALASIRELSVAYNRAASRIVEMTSPRWWDQVLNDK